jgi:hypothetical protein
VPVGYGETWRDDLDNANAIGNQEESLDSWETRKAKNKAKGYNGNGQGTPLDMQVKIIGQAAPASSSSLGSRQELSVDWRTPQAQEAGAKVETLFTKDGAPAMPGQRAYRKTPSGKLVLQSQTINQQVEMVQNWATPRANERDGTRTPNGNPAKDGIPLGMQARQWGTPTARDHKSGRGNEQREYKELTPMVERRQSGKLNSRWVETADGPADWLDDAELYTTCDNRTDELRLLGNGVVPAVAERAFRLLFGELTAHNTTQ